MDSATKPTTPLQQRASLFLERSSRGEYGGASATLSERVVAAYAVSGQRPADVETWSLIRETANDAEFAADVSAGLEAEYYRELAFLLHAILGSDQLAAAESESQSVDQPRPDASRQLDHALPAVDELVTDELVTDELVTDELVAAHPSDFSLPGVARAISLGFLLLAFPVVVIGWQFAAADSPGPRAGQSLEVEATSFTYPLQAIDRRAWQVYWGGLAAVTLLLLVNAFRQDAEGTVVAVGVLAMVIGMGAMALAPVYPITGPLVYLILSYAFPRESGTTEFLMQLGTMSWLPALSVAALLVRWIRQRHRPGRLGNPILVVLLGLMVWLALVVFAAVADGRPLAPELVHRTSRFVQAFVMCLVVAYSPLGLVDLRVTALAIGLTLFMRQQFLSTNLFLEQNLAMLVAVALPLVLGVAMTAATRVSQLGYFLVAVYLLRLIVVIQNRGAALGLVAALLVLWMASRHRVRWFLVASPLMLVGLAFLPGSGIAQRFGEIYRDGEFRGSAASRIQLWKAGLEMAREHPLWGVGPDNFPLMVQQYDPSLPPHPAHNSVLEMAAETGLVGMGLYLLLILTATCVLGREALRHGRDWRGVLVGSILAGVWAHLVAGLFLSNHSLVLTYVLLGAGVAISQAPVTRVYRSRLYLPLPDDWNIRLTGLVSRLPRIFSGMPVSWNLLGSRANSGAGQHSARLLTPAWLQGIAGVYALIAIAGSLVPFSFHATGFPAALDQFKSAMLQPLDFADRSDWLSNMLLFVPLGFLLSGAWTLGDAGTRSRLHGWRKLGASLAVISACMILSSCLELLQVWFPPRTVNPNDVVAETIGAGIGAVTFLFVGPRLVELANRLLAGRTPVRKVELVLLVYAALLTLAALWPFDLTINPLDLVRKAREGRLIVSELSSLADLKIVLVHAVLLIPVGVLLRTLAVPRGQRVRPVGEALFGGLLWLLALEAGRLVVMSQTASVAHVVGGAIGIWAGGLLPAPRWAFPFRQQSDDVHD